VWGQRLYAHPYIAQMGGLDGFNVVDGKMAVPSTPGLGFDLVPEVLRAELLPGEPFWDD
jgi:L-alanine-DL-glutamate epimerase-like enolase superfamily enzyme